MKKVILILAVLISTSAFAQSDSTKVKSKPTAYTSFGLSVSNGDDFKASSYVAIENGIMYENLAIGAIFGRGNLTDMGKSTDNIGKYYYEVKATGYIPLGILFGNVIFGWGGYFNSVHTFIEYGGGISYSKGKFGYGVTYSNWDGVNYVTPSITFNY